MSKTSKEEPARRRLGRGLGSLLSAAIPVEIQPKPAIAPPQVAARSSSAEPSAGPAAAQPARGPTYTGIDLIDLKSIVPSPHQPRSHFDDAGIESLAASIRAAGVMQPIIVRPKSTSGKQFSRGGVRAGGSQSPDATFELVAGERRWRAAQRAGLAAIPAVVRELDDHTAAEWALVENLQREDLDPIEQAEAFSTLINRFALTHQEVAERVGLDRSTISNALRMLELDQKTRDAVRQGTLSAGHAKALLGIADPIHRRRLAEAAVKHAWSVRELEARCRVSAPERTGEFPASTGGRSAHLQGLEKQLAVHLGTRVQIRAGRKKGSGALVIHFYDLDQFEGLMQKIGFEGS